MNDIKYIGLLSLGIVIGILYSYVRWEVVPTKYNHQMPEAYKSVVCASQKPKSL